MSSPITIDLPDDLREYAEAVARSTGRTLESVLLGCLRAVLGGMGGIDPADLPGLPDEALWGIVRQPSAWVVDARLSELKSKSPLTPAEHAEIDALSDRRSEWLLLRDEAALILKSRGFDVPKLPRAK